MMCLPKNFEEAFWTPSLHACPPMSRSQNPNEEVVIKFSSINEPCWAPHVIWPFHAMAQDSVQNRRNPGKSGQPHQNAQRHEVLGPDPLRPLRARWIHPAHQGRGQAGFPAAQRGFAEARDRSAQGRAEGHVPLLPGPRRALSTADLGLRCFGRAGGSPPRPAGLCVRRTSPKWTGRGSCMCSSSPSTSSSRSTEPLRPPTTRSRCEGEAGRCPST